MIKLHSLKTYIAEHSQRGERLVPLSTEESLNTEPYLPDPYHPHLKKWNMTWLVCL